MFARVSPAAHFLGFSALPISFFLILIAMTITYLTLVEFAKSRFYAAAGHPQRPPSTRHQRHQRRLARRAARFTHISSRNARNVPAAR